MSSPLQGNAYMGSSFSQGQNIAGNGLTPPLRPGFGVPWRSPPFQVQIIRKLRPDGGSTWWVSVGVGGQEVTQLGPYPTVLTLAEAIALTSVDVQLDDKHGINKQFEEK